VASGDYAAVHVLEDGRISAANYSGALHQMREGQLNEAQWMKAKNVVAAAGLAELTSQYQPPDDPSLIYEGVFYTLMLRSEQQFHSVTLHDALLPDSYRYAVQMLLRLADTQELAELDGWFLQASEMRTTPTMIGNSTLTNRGYELSRIRDELPQIMVDDTLASEAPEILSAIWYVDKFVPLTDNTRMELIARIGKQQKFYLKHAGRLYLLGIVNSNR
jgi:hypothetical protein